MATSQDIISYMQRRTSLSVETFLISPSLGESEVAHSVISLANQLVKDYSDRYPSFQRRNYRFLMQTIEILAQLLEPITESGSHKSSISTYLTEFYIFLNKAKDLIIYCLESRRLRLLISNSMISNYFHNLDREILCILDVINWEDMNLTDDIAKLIEFMKKKLGQEKIFVDQVEESLKRTIFGFYEALEAGEVPDLTNIHKYFVQDLGITDAKTWRLESESIEDLIIRHENDSCVPLPVLRGFAALMQYGKLLIFSVQEEPPVVNEPLVLIPDDFLCPITQDLMIDPVTLTTGHTFERTAILDWFKRGNLRCPITRTALSGIILIPNKAVQSMISKWCAANGMPYDPPALLKTPEERRRNNIEDSSRAVLVAKKATLKLALDLLSQGVESAQISALAQLRLLTESDKQMCIEIVNFGSVPILMGLLKSENRVKQENCAVTILHLSLYRENTDSIMRTKGSLTIILKVIQSAHTDTARQHAIALIRNLSVVPEYKKKIAKEKGLLKAVTELLYSESIKDKINAMQILRNLSTMETRIFMIKAGIAKVMVKAMFVQEFKKPAADVLALLVTLRKGAKKIRKEKLIVIILTRMMQWGTPMERESATRTLLAFFSHGGSKAMRRSFQRPQLRDLITSLLRSHLARDRNKAARLLRLHEKFRELI
ncbi:hypothetical protein RND81_11G111400 [Saponaria officinalis]|uniref:RING-type E3 ubiquitin transferase n=1 Tax=Saponaria officinalis TaxID=3572 RepID=A0AAW1HMD6_SAPOF